jgi:hypothetical protein
VVVRYLFFVPLQNLQTPQRHEWLSDRDTYIAGHILNLLHLLKVLVVPKLQRLANPLILKDTPQLPN